MIFYKKCIFFLYLALFLQFFVSCDNFPTIGFLNSTETTIMIRYEINETFIKENLGFSMQASPVIIKHGQELSPFCFWEGIPPEQMLASDESEVRALLQEFFKDISVYTMENENEPKLLYMKDDVLKCKIRLDLPSLIINIE